MKSKIFKLSFPYIPRLVYVAEGVEASTTLAESKVDRLWLTETDWEHVLMGAIQVVDEEQIKARITEALQYRAKQLNISWEPT